MNITDLLEMDPDFLMDEYRRISADLAMLGLSEYESRAYIALVAHGVSDADTVATTAQIPRTSAYKVLETLEQKGFVVSGEGRPKFYNPEPPENIKGRIFERLENTFDKLASIREILKEQGMPQLVFTLGGRTKVLDKIAEYIDSAKESVVMSTPNLKAMRQRIDRNISAAIKRGVSVTLIIPHGQKSFPGVNNICRKRLIATDLIIDGQKALIASPELDVCGFTDNATIAAHLEGFLEIVMEHDD